MDLKSEASKSVRVSKKREPSYFSIMKSIDKDVNEFLSELTNRSQKNKLSQIYDTFKLLAKRCAEYESANEELSKMKEDIVYIKDNYEQQLKKLKTEKNELMLKFNNTSMIPELEVEVMRKDETLRKLSNRNEQMFNQLKDEKQRNNNLATQVKELEDTLHSLNQEFVGINNKYAVTQRQIDSFDKMHNEMKRKKQVKINQCEELKKVNETLSSKLLQAEQDIRLHHNDLKKTFKKNVELEKLYEELEKENERLRSDILYREERLNALRLMNSKLENKSIVLVKKWEDFQIFHKKNSHKISEYEELKDFIHQNQEKLQNANEEILNLKNENQDQEKNLEAIKKSEMEYQNSYNTTKLQFEMFQRQTEMKFKKIQEKSSTVDLKEKKPIENKKLYA